MVDADLQNIYFIINPLVTLSRAVSVDRSPVKMQDYFPRFISIAMIGFHTILSPNGNTAQIEISPGISWGFKSFLRDSQKSNATLMVGSHLVPSRSWVPESHIINWPRSFSHKH